MNIVMEKGQASWMAEKEQNLEVHIQIVGIFFFHLLYCLLKVQKGRIFIYTSITELQVTGVDLILVFLVPKVGHL